MKRAPVLSLILCSRNDAYMGNSRWRLETTLNYVADCVSGIGRSDDVEIIVTDWGSETPLSEVLSLSREARNLVSFLLVPPAIATPLQKDSPFPEVLALNAAARRSRGAFIGRIDQDTLAGERFLSTFFDMVEGRRELPIPIERALMFSNLRMIPYRFASRCPSYGDVRRFARQFGPRLWVEVSNVNPFYGHGVGIWLLHRDVWQDCRGYDERLIYMNGMEIDMIRRLMQKYQLVNLGKLVDYDFLHLEHYHPWVPRMSSYYRKTQQVSTNPEFLVNGEDWGLADQPLELTRPRSIGNDAGVDGALSTLAYGAVVATVAAQVGWDRVVVSSRESWRQLRNFRPIWKRRFSIIASTVAGTSMYLWPALIVRRWWYGPADGTAGRRAVGETKQSGARAGL